MEPKLTRPVLPVIIAGVSLVTLLVVLLVAIFLCLQTRVAVCSFKASAEQGIQDSRSYLAMTPAEREAKYGPALGHIPEDVIRQGLARQTATVRSLSPLRC